MLSYRKFVEWLNRPLVHLSTVLRQQIKSHEIKTEAKNIKNIYQFPTVSPLNPKEIQEISKKKKSG